MSKLTKRDKIVWRDSGSRRYPELGTHIIYGQAGREFAGSVHYNEAIYGYVGTIFMKDYDKIGFTPIKESPVYEPNGTGKQRAREWVVHELRKLLKG